MDFSIWMMRRFWHSITILQKRIFLRFAWLLYISYFLFLSPSFSSKFRIFRVWTTNLVNYCITALVLRNVGRFIVTIIAPWRWKRKMRSVGPQVIILLKLSWCSGWSIILAHRLRWLMMVCAVAYLYVIKLCHLKSLYLLMMCSYEYIIFELGYNADILVVFGPLFVKPCLGWVLFPFLCICPN